MAKRRRRREELVKAALLELARESGWERLTMVESDHPIYKIKG